MLCKCHSYWEVEVVINLVQSPQRADFEAEYSIKEDILTVKINDKEEIFDFTDMPEGRAEEIIIEVLPINPIVNVEKVGDTINITVIRFYGEDEKHLFEVVQNG